MMMMMMMMTMMLYTNCQSSKSANF